MSIIPALLRALLVATLLLGAAQAQSRTDLPTGAESLAPDRFRDVPSGHWAEDAIKRLATLGVLTGYPDMTFGGSREATRYELAVVAARLVDLIGGSLAEMALDPGFWQDVERAAQALGRVRRLEEALTNTPSLARVESLERRLADLEAYANEQLGEERFPLEAPDFPATAADTVDPLPEARQTVPAAARRGDAELPGLAGVSQRRPLSWWIGLAAGYPLPATVHAGLRDLLPALHLRTGVGYDLAGAFALELSALYTLPVAVDAPILPYLGLGPLLRSRDGTSAPALHALIGMEVPLGRSFDERGFLYLELGPEVTFEGGAGTAVTGRAGLGYRF